MKRAVEVAIRIGAIAGLIVWCFIICAAVPHTHCLGRHHRRSQSFTVTKNYELAFGGRRITAAVLITLLMLVLLVVPSVLLGNSLVSGARYVVKTVFQSGELHIPATAG